jgi:hypothetical protein
MQYVFVAILSLTFISCDHWPDDLVFESLDSNPSLYDREVLADRPVLFLTMGHAESTTETDQSGHENSGAYFPRDHIAKATVMPNGDGAAAFDGYKQYLEVRDHDSLSIPTTGYLTFEAWIRPDVLDFPVVHSDDYVHWAGKGESGEHEYVFRMYSLNNDVERPQRISCYAYNLGGGLGAGSAFQEPVAVGEWVHVTAVYNTKELSPVNPTGFTRIYKNGELRDTSPLLDYQIIPRNGEAPLRVGTRDLKSFFKGAIGKVAIYDYELPAKRVRAHYERMIFTQLH